LPLYLNNPKGKGVKNPEEEYRSLKCSVVREMKDNLAQIYTYENVKNEKR
jgi:hypothetical protein